MEKQLTSPEKDLLNTVIERVASAMRLDEIDGKECYTDQGNFVLRLSRLQMEQLDSILDKINS